MTPEQSNAKSESELVRRIEQLLAADSPSARRGTIGFGDDMASLCEQQPGLLWTSDMLMDGVDFVSALSPFASRKPHATSEASDRPSLPPLGPHDWCTIGRKAMAVNLSDCAAMAVQPIAALLTLGLDDRLSIEDALDLVRGARDCGMRFGCPIVGGDTNSWDHPTVISITVVARAPAGRKPISRSGARVSDTIFLTGPVGGSLLGRHLSFEPRIAAALEIGQRLVPHAMIDISDGLALDLHRLIEASGCGALLDETLLEEAIHPDALILSRSSGQTPLEHALYDGEDFELLVTLPQNTADSTWRGIGLIPIGQVTERFGVRLRRTDGEERVVERRGWEHFR